MLLTFARVYWWSVLIESGHMHMDRATLAHDYVIICKSNTKCLCHTWFLSVVFGVVQYTPTILFGAL